MKVLVVLSRVPWPLEKGDKLRAYHLMREWSAKHDIYLFCLTDNKVHSEAEAKLNDICKNVVICRIPKIHILYRMALGIINKLPFQVNYFYSKSAQMRFDDLVDEIIPDHIFCQLARTAEYPRRYRLINKSIDYMDAFSTGMLRMSNKASWPLKSLMRIEHNRLRNYENEIQREFQSKYIISEQDREQLNYVSDLTVVPNGIDPCFLGDVSIEQKRYDILFTGNMSYRPNVESAKFLISEVMPLVWDKIPNATVCLCGANPSNSIKSLSSKRVVVTGWVDDIAEVYHSSRMFVAPMIVNTGLQNKLLEAMACGIPCVTTTLANNALKATNQNEILIGDNSEELASAIFSILMNVELSDKIAKNGSNYVRKNFTWPSAAAMMETNF